MFKIWDEIFAPEQGHPILKKLPGRKEEIIFDNINICKEKEKLNEIKDEDVNLLMSKFGIE